MIVTNPLAVPCPYEVGDILHTTNNTAPSTRWPGTTWKAITTMLLGASAAHPAGSTGGEETHTLTPQEMPRHNHEIASSYTTDPQEWDPWTFKDSATTQFGASGGESNPWSTTFQGGGAAHNNMPPYTSVYIWQRTG